MNNDRTLGWVIIVFFSLLAFGLSGCRTDDDDDNQNPVATKSTWKIENSTCISAECHGKPTLSKTVTVTGGASEVVPLYVDSAAFVAEAHDELACADCHTDITVNGSSHGPAMKVFGGWARLSTKSGTVQLATTDSTRNYGTTASTACASCHTQYHNPDAAHIRIPRLRESSVRTLAGHSIGENYEDNNCARCHATCATCHFESEITCADPAPEDLLTSWDQIQTSGDNAISNTSPKSEYRMNWTANVRDHKFRNATDLKSSNKVCQSCHIGWYRPAQIGYTMRGNVADSMYATGVKRHPQFQELALGEAHSATRCVFCHGASLHDQVSIEQGPECVDCHVGKAGSHPTPDHSDFNIKCIACHTNHRAADFARNGQNNWINPENGRIGPVVVKYAELLNWYPHRITRSVNCNMLCHFEGNRVGAASFGAVAGPVRPTTPYVPNIDGTDE